MGVEQRIIVLVVSITDDVQQSATLGFPAYPNAAGELILIDGKFGVRGICLCKGVAETRPNSLGRRTRTE